MHMSECGADEEMPTGGRDTRPSRPLAFLNPARLALRGAGLLDLDDLPAAVDSAVRADVVRAPHLVAVPALDQLRWFQEMMPAAVALPVPADSLLR